MSLPPYAQLLGVRLEQDDDGAPVLVMPFGDQALGRPGFLHGGAIGGLLEVTAIATLKATLDADVTIKPINLTVDYMRGGREAETRAAATIRRLGTRIANVDVHAWQDDRDRPIAAARLTFLLKRG